MIPENRQFSKIHTPAISESAYANLAWAVLTWCVGSGEPLVSVSNSSHAFLLHLRIPVRTLVKQSIAWGRKESPMKAKISPYPTIRKPHLIAWHITSLLAGSIIYILFRASSLKMFSWFETLGVDIMESHLRKNSLLIVGHLPDWFLYSLPDGLWAFSYMCLILSIWRRSISKQNIFWISIVPFIAIGSEIAQLFGFVQGTFDIADIACYVIGFVLPFLIFNKSINYKF